MTSATARRMTRKLGGKWVQFGVLPCPVCSEDAALRIEDQGRGILFSASCACRQDAAAGRTMRGAFEPSLLKRWTPRRITSEFSGRWIERGEASCPVCGRDKAILIKDDPSGGWPRVISACNCDERAVGDAIADISARRT